MATVKIVYPQLGIIDEVEVEETEEADEIADEKDYTSNTVI